MSLESDYKRWHESMALAESDQEVPLYPWQGTFLKLLPDLNGKTVLEVGCGRGAFARFIGCRYPASRIIATDFSATAIEHARSRLLADSNVTSKVPDTHNSPFGDHSFDYIISCECLEHVESPAKMMSSIARCLKTGGGFIITTENYFNGMILAWINSWLKGKPFNSGSGVQPRKNVFRFLEGTENHQGVRLEDHSYGKQSLRVVVAASVCTGYFFFRGFRQSAPQALVETIWTAFYLSGY